MKMFRQGAGLLVAALTFVACVFLAGMGQEAFAQTAANPLQKTESLTAGTVTLTHHGFTTVWVGEAKGLVRLVSITDGASTNTLITVKAFTSKPTSADLDNSTVGLSGYEVQEGAEVFLRPTGPWLGVYCVTGPGYFSANRVE